MKSDLIALLGQQAVDRLNIAAQIVLLLCAAISFYEARAHRGIKMFVEGIGRLQRYIWFGKWGFVLGTPRPSPGKEFSERVYFLASAIIGAAVVLSGHGVIYWALYPVRQFANAVWVWKGLSLSDWRSALIPVQSILLFLWGILLVVTVYPGGFGIPIKSALFVADWTGRRFSRSAFHFVLFGLTLAATVIVIATSADWTS